MKKKSEVRVVTESKWTLLGYVKNGVLVQVNPRFKEYLRKFYKQIEEEPGFTIIDGLFIEGTMRQKANIEPAPTEITRGFELYVSSEDIERLNTKALANFYCRTHGITKVQDFFWYKKICFSNK